MTSPDTPQPDALIGATGFVGTNLRLSHDFAAHYASRTIGDSAGRSFGTVVCAAAPATMWEANRNPDRDLANIDALIGHLRGIKAQRFVLISTIAVLADANAGLDEGSDAFETDKAYGRNRRHLEVAAQEIFPTCHVLRLPALYGAGLKKNLLFDMLNPAPSFLTEARLGEIHDAIPEAARVELDAVYGWEEGLAMYRCDRALLRRRGREEELVAALGAIGATALAFANGESRFQFYGLAELWADVGRVIEHRVPVLHLAPEPIEVADLYRELTGEPFPPSTASVYREDMRTRHADLWGRAGEYSQDRATVLDRLRDFFASQRAAA